MKTEKTTLKGFFLSLYFISFNWLLFYVFF